MTPVSNTALKSFWEANPVAAEGIAAQAGTPEFFTVFDALREADDCEPWDPSDPIHGCSNPPVVAYSMSAVTAMCWIPYITATKPL